MSWFEIDFRHINMRAEKQARKAVFEAAYLGDENAVPEYKIPKHRPWWAFWRPIEWETVRGVSRAQMRRAQEANHQDLRERHQRLMAIAPNASPYTNLYAPWLDPLKAEEPPHA